MKPFPAKTSIILSLSILIVLAIRSICFNPWLDIETCLQDPEAYHNSIVTQFREPRILEINEHGFILAQKQQPPIQVNCDTAGLRVNEYIGLTAVFHKDGYLTADYIHIAKNRRMKIWLSTLPVLMILLLFFRYFRFNLQTCQFTLRGNA